eukprot:TRINITY_DN3140_c5_g1_i1.p1 TRINITY_DN3140_c5_g1~~TRINITY_DN3140_c5_g1_i1.p1  ORF type:complete len:1055 (+),score=351.82 TRINITY_DN3140_c5_g1_i1:49-3213(+)
MSHYFKQRQDVPSRLFANLTRPPPPEDWERRDLTVQLMEASQYRTLPLPGMPGPAPGSVNEVTAIRLFGVTREGNSALVHVHGFQPYFWMEAPPNFKPNHLEPFRRLLNSIVEPSLKVPQAVRRIEVQPRRSILNYQPAATNFLRIIVQMPGMVPRLRGLLEGKNHQNEDQGGICFPQLWRGPATFETYESNVPFELRFLVDTGISGSGWITCPVGRFRRKPNPLSVCQIEIDIAFDELVPRDSVGEYMCIAPARVLSFDIECQGRPGKFPEAEHDPVIQIANVVRCHGHTEPVTQNVFCLGKVSPIPGVQLFCFEDERDLLLAWAKFLIVADPDVMTGYNIVNFDMTYLLNRACALRLDSFPFWSRIRGQRTNMRAQVFQNKAHGKREYTEIEMPGRIQIDLLVVIQHEHKLRSYSLNNVSHVFLGEQKEDVHHSMIASLQTGNEETRNRLARYCWKDALLPLLLMNKLMTFVNLVEMARVTGVPIGWLIDRGQQIKVFSQILRKSRSKETLFPHAESGATETSFTGATVIEPSRGFHNYPVATLDFASLYPSIMMAHNLCYSTLLNAEQRANPGKFGLDLQNDCGKTPDGDWFVKREKSVGILPDILNELLTSRKAAKKAMAQATDPMEKAVYNGRQLALKLSANSVYGFTGTNKGKLPCFAISAGVTSFGRSMIETTQTEVEAHYTKANGYPDNARVIYGDTDSVFIVFGEKLDLSQSMKLGEEAAALVTKKFPAPVRLEFEKCYLPMILMNKKRYAGLLFTNPNKHDRIDCKGIEAVRRDNCPLVAHVQNTVLRKVLMERSVENAVAFVQQTVSDLLMNRLDISQLIISKTLKMEKDEYAGKQAHAELVERMRKRDPASAPGVGDRVPYVIVEGPAGAKIHEKAEDPLYALEHNVPIDSEHYLTHQLKKPLERLFDGVLENVEGKLFKGEHTRQITKVAPSKGGIMKFAKVILTCLGCRAAMSTETGSLCTACIKRGKEAEVYAKLLSKRNQCETLFGRVWTQCQRCQGSLHQDVICSNRDCSVFYMRRKIQKDLTEAQAAVDRFGVLDW